MADWKEGRASGWMVGRNLPCLFAYFRERAEIAAVYHESRGIPYNTKYERERTFVVKL